MFGRMRSSGVSKGKVKRRKPRTRVTKDLKKQRIYSTRDYCTQMNLLRGETNGRKIESYSENKQEGGRKHASDKQTEQCDQVTKDKGREAGIA